MKRTLFRSAVIIIALVAFTAGAFAQAKVTLTLMIDNQSSQVGLKAVADAIEKKYNIATSFELRPGGAEGDNLLKTRLATGDYADLNFYNAGSLFQALNPAQYFLDLTKEPFMKNVMDSFKPGVTVGGKVYGVPSGSAMGGGWLYNKKIYAKLGLKVPKTWKDLLANAAKIKAAGITPIVASYKDDWTAQLIVLADYYNVQAQKPKFANDYTAHKAGFANTPLALRGFEKLQEIYKKGYISKEPVATGYGEAMKQLLDGTAAMYPMLTFALANMESMDAAKAQDIGFFAQPGDSADKNGLTVWLSGGIYGSKESDKVDAIKKWLGFYATPEAMAIFASAEKPGGPFMIKGAKLPDNVLPAVKDMMPYFDTGKTAPALEFLSPIKGPNLPQICVEAGLAIKTPAECAAAYDKDVEKQAKQLGLAGW